MTDKKETPQEQTAQQLIDSKLKKLQSDYSQLCLRAGEAQYLISVKEDELKELNARIKDINNEAHKLQSDVQAANTATKVNATNEVVKAVNG